LRFGAIVVALFMVAPTLAGAGVGKGEFAADRGVLATVHAEPLSQIGEDAIRFSTTPQLGGPAWVVEWRRDDQGNGRGKVTFLYWTRSDDPVVTGSLMLGLSKREYDQLSAKVDVLLRRPEPCVGDCGSVIIACTDGPGYVTERRSNGQTSWMTGDCGDHPNNEIAKLMLSSIWPSVCAYRPTTTQCAPFRVPHRPR
jgi:hypothetical protein